MKDQISNDLAAAGVKFAPVATVAAVEVATSLSLQDWVLIVTLVYGILQTSLIIVRGWGDWHAWGRARAQNVRDLWARVRRRG